MSTRTFISLVFVMSQAGCFPDASVSRARLSSDAHLDVRDARGSAWSQRAMPRLPTLRLWFEAPSPAAEAPSTWLVRGYPSEALLDDLGTTTVRERTAARIVPTLRSVSHSHVELRAAEPLRRDAAYSLIWATSAGPAVITLRSAPCAEAGASLLDSLPAQGASAVPRDQRWVLWSFDGIVALASNAEATLSRAEQHTALPLANTACLRLGFRAGTCLVAELPSALAADAAYEIALPASLTDARGALLAVAPVAFTTGDRTSTGTPALTPFPCGADELTLGPLCASTDDEQIALRARSSEPVHWSVSGCGAHEGGLSVASELNVHFPRTDAAGCHGVLRLRNGENLHSDWPFALPPAPDLARVSIDEVRADPLGAEPDQEYVELLNFGSAPVSLAGFSLARDGEMHGVAFDDTATLAPGERMLAVAPSFVARAGGEDSEPAASVRILRLEHALSLSSTGTALVLRDAEGQRLSSSPSMAAEEPGACIARRSDLRRSGARADFEGDPEQRCTPGTATAFP